MKKIDTSKTVNELHGEQLKTGDKIADIIAAFVGFWRFVGIMSGLLALWIIYNSIPGLPHFDLYPFILLNLCLSFLAGYTGPFIIMSQNRQSAKDRIAAEHDYEAAKLEIEGLVKLVIAQHEAQNEHLDAQDKSILQIVENRRPRNGR